MTCWHECACAKTQNSEKSRLKTSQTCQKQLAVAQIHGPCGIVMVWPRLTPSFKPNSATARVQWARHTLLLVLGTMTCTILGSWRLVKSMQYNTLQNLRDEWCYTSGCWAIWGYTMNMPWFGNSSDGLVLDFSTRPDNHGEFSDLPRPGTPPGFTIWVYQSATITNIGESSPAIGAVTDLGVVETDKAEHWNSLSPKLLNSNKASRQTWQLKKNARIIDVPI